MVVPRSPWVLLLLLACCGWIVAHDRVARGLPETEARCERRVQDRMFFGLQGHDGLVSDVQWQRFVAEEITPRFPDGLTVVVADGRWRDGNGRIQSEPSRLVEIVRPDDDAGARRITEIIDRYKSRHRQQAVLLVRASVQACL